jgi:hypothetical protein
MAGIRVRSGADVNRVLMRSMHHRALRLHSTMAKRCLLPRVECKKKLFVHTRCLANCIHATLDWGGGAAPADRTLTPRVISLLRVSSAFGVIGARPHKDTHTQRVGGGASERERERRLTCHSLMANAREG